LLALRYNYDNDNDNDNNDDLVQFTNNVSLAPFHLCGHVGGPMSMAAAAAAAAANASS
jgi:hypothetical protein